MKNFLTLSGQEKTTLPHGQSVSVRGKSLGMKTLVFLGLVLISFAGLAKPLVMITYFDAFNGADFNNSERIAKTLEARLNNSDSPFELKLCPLNTIFDKAYAQTEECLKSLISLPIMVIGLGESTCQLKVETIMRNNDKTHAPDNGGNERDGPIINGGEKFLGLKYPLPQMYCALSETERNSVDLSNNAGSFVCNNTAYQMSYFHPELQYGFIHVPANNCFNLARKTELALLQLEKMLIKGVTYLSGSESDNDLPHSSNEKRLPINKSELKNFKQKYRGERCMSEYFERSKSAEERSGIFFGRMN